MSENTFYNFFNRSRSRSRSNTHARHSSIGGRPATRLQSRPLSSTTTATNTTITPPTPTQSRRPTKYPPDPPSRPSTPKSSTTRQMLQNFFGIPLSPRKSSSLSRPSSPRPSQDIPPLPPPFALSRSPSNPNPPILVPQTPSPAGSLSRTTSKGKSRASIPTKLDFFRNQRLFSSQKSASQLSEPSFTQPDSVGTPSYSTSSLTSASDFDPPPVPPLPPQLASTVQVSRPRPVVPSITHTPPTPQRPLPSSPVRSTRPESADSKHPGWRPLARVSEKEARDRERERERGRVLEREAKERRRWSPRLPSPKLWGSKESGRVVIAVTQQHPDKQRASGGGVARNGSKHGSFDFEKPVWTKPGGSAGTRSGHSRSGDSLHTGVSETGERIKSTRPPDSPRFRSARTVPAHQSGASTSSHAPSHSTGLTGAGSHSAPGQGASSSLGRATSKRLPQPISVGVSHGPFAFEPAVPSPTMAQSADARNTLEREHKRERHREPQREREKEREKTPGHRAAGKGRSLDLGLGLSWAPTRVREDALMASFGKRLRPRDREMGKSPVASDVTEVFRGVLSDDGFATFKKYVHRFDAHAIPFDGPSGIVTRVENLLDSAHSLDAEGKRDLLDRFIRILLQHA